MDALFLHGVPKTMKPAAMSPDTVYRGGIKKCLRIGVSDVISETDKFLCGTDAGDFRKFCGGIPALNLLQSCPSVQLMENKEQDLAAL